MADNVTITEGSGTQIAADDVAGVKYQRVKVAIGEDGVANDLSSSNPLPVTVSGSPTVTEESLGMIQAALQTLVGMLPITYSASLPKASVVFSSDSTLPTLPTLANVTTVNSVTGVTGVTTVNTVSNITNFGGVPSSEAIYAMQQAAFNSFLNTVLVTT